MGVKEPELYSTRNNINTETIQINEAAISCWCTQTQLWQQLSSTQNVQMDESRAAFIHLHVEAGTMGAQVQRERESTKT